MSLFRSELTLQDTDLVAEGQERWVYLNSEYPDCVFKLQKPVDARALKNDMKSWSIRRFPSLINRIVHREYAAYLRACLGSQDDIDTLPVNRLYGFAASNRGLVQVSEKVSMDGQTLGPTIWRLYESGSFTDDHLELLNVFAASFLRWDIPTNDISRHNIVLGKRNGTEMFLAVDGFGDIKVVPMRTYIKYFRRRALVRRLDRLAKRIGRQFDAELFRFN